MLTIPDTVYDILNKLQRWLPSLGIFYTALATIWKWPLADEVNNTILAVAALLAATLEILTSNYYAKKSTAKFDATAFADEVEDL